jgi:hypothetical protein
MVLPMQVQQQLQQQLSLAFSSSGGSAVLSHQSKAALAEVLGIVLGDPAAVPHVLLATEGSSGNSGSGSNGRVLFEEPQQWPDMGDKSEGQPEVACGMRMGGDATSNQAAAGRVAPGGNGAPSWVAAGGFGLPVASLGMTAGYMKVQN